MYPPFRISAKELLKPNDQRNLIENAKKVNLPHGS